MKKIISLLLAVMLVISAVPMAYAADTQDYSLGTTVKYTAANNENYTITVPAKLAPGAEGTVTLDGYWASDTVVTVTAEENVVLTNSINANDKKTLDVYFDGISEAGDNNGKQTFTAPVSVADIEAALFGTWNGQFNYTVGRSEGSGGSTGGDSGSTDNGNTDEGTTEAVLFYGVPYYNADSTYVFNEDGSGTYNDLPFAYGWELDGNTFVQPGSLAGCTVSDDGYTISSSTSTWVYTPDTGDDGDGSLPAAGKTAEEYTWAEISAISEAGKADEYFNLGDTKTLILNDDTQFAMEIVAFNADEKADGSGTASITWISEYTALTHAMNADNSNAGGWEVSDMRNWLQNDYYDNLPANLKASIVTVEKTYYDKTTQTTKSCNDTLWIPSYREMFGNSDNSSNYETSGTDYTAYFTDAYARQKHSFYWLRTPVFSYDTNFWDINGNGNSNYATSAKNENGVIFGFCT